jgi:hypothetical protein
MKPSLFRLVLWAVTAGIVLPVVAFSQQPILSPRDSVRLALDTSFVDVNYGRPSMRGRVVMGQLVPWNKVWRTGANRATHFSTGVDLMIEGVPVPRGRYTLFTLPSPTGWKVILNKQTDQWGTVYDPSLDLARFDAVVDPAPAVVDTFTIRLDPAGKDRGVLRLLWEHTTVSARFEKNDHIRPLSPFDSVGITLGAATVHVTYSRPAIRGRDIWGCVVPYDSVWRTGANGATTFTCDDAVVLGGVTVPRGSYTLYSIASSNGLTLIVSKKPAGSPAYDPRMDLVRISMPSEASNPPVDPFKIWFEKSRTSPRTGRLLIGWADRVYNTTLNAK